MCSIQSLIDRTRAPLDLDRIKTIFGDQNRPHYDTRKKNPTRWGVVVETPTLRNLFTALGMVA